MRRRSKFSVFVLLGLVVAAPAIHADVPPAVVGTIEQEMATRYTTDNGLPSGDILSITVAPDGAVAAGTTEGAVSFDGTSWNWIHQIPRQSIPVLHVFEDAVLGVVGDTLYWYKNDVLNTARAPAEYLNAAAVAGRNPYAGASNGLYRLEGTILVAETELNAMLGDDKAIYAVAGTPGGTVAAGGAAGLFLKQPGGEWEALFPHTADGRSWAPRDVRALAFDAADRLWFASAQGVGRYDGEWTLYTGQEGLPYNGFTSMAHDAEGRVWFGTDMGVIWYDGEHWAYRQGKRWLPDDQVRDIAVAPNGDLWFATAGGVGRIEFRPMTLREKAGFYEEQMDLIRRTEYGYVSEVRVAEPGNPDSEIFYSDSDNDGLWTSMYGAAQCFAYAATGDPAAKERAVKAFRAVKFLSDAPAQGVINQQPGYVARTVVPTTEPDPNERSGYTLEGQMRRQQTSDALWKAYAPRFVKTQDGKYWYKTDTSSDELDGHYFFYPLYYDLVCETEAEKEEVREVVRRITDHLARNNFRLIDHDGKVTRWGDYSPETLNHEHMWYIERGLKSLSMLSYLTVAEHMLGDEKYTRLINVLRTHYAYDTNAMIAKVQRGIGSGNQSDDEMAIMCYYNLIRLTKDDKLREEMLYSFFKYWVLEHPEMNPFFNFAYAAVGMDATYTNAWATHDISPWDGWLDDSVETLVRFPLDRFNWAHRNSHRLDIVRLPRQTLEPYQTAAEYARANRGHRVNGKVLPVDERHFNHWNTNPFQLDYGGNGAGLASGTVYLLPYYMGLYHGFIVEE